MKSTATKTVESKPGPKLGRRPDFSGTAGRMVEMPADLLFGAKARVSPYDVLLYQLATAAMKSGTDKPPVLEFDDIKAKASLWARSRKLGIKILYAERDGKLYIKFAGYQPDSEQFKKLAREKITDVLRAGERTEIQVAVELRKQGFEDLDAGTVGAILKQAEQFGQVMRKNSGAWVVKP